MRRVAEVNDIDRIFESIPELTEERLAMGALINEAGFIQRPPLTPIERVRIPWILEIAKSVFPITNIDLDPPGTAFYFRNDIWVTNHHCVYYQPGKTIQEKLNKTIINSNPRVWLSGAKYLPEEWPGYDVNGKGDVIVMKVDTPVELKSLAVATRSIPIGIEVPSIMLGFPDTLPFERGPYVSYGAESWKYERGSIHGSSTLRHEMGNSGSPVFDLDGNLIGIFSGMFQDVSRIEELMDSLR